MPAAPVEVGEQSVVTHTSGRFTIDKVDTGEQRVSVAAEGYGPYTQTLEVQKGDNTLNVALDDGTVTGVLRENAVVRKPIKKGRWAEDRSAVHLTDYAGNPRANGALASL